MKKSDTYILSARNTEDLVKAIELGDRNNARWYQIFQDSWEQLVENDKSKKIDWTWLNLTE